MFRLTPIDVAIRVAREPTKHSVEKLRGALITLRDASLHGNAAERNTARSLAADVERELRSAPRWDRTERCAPRALGFKTSSYRG